MRLELHSPKTPLTDAQRDRALGLLEAAFDRFEEIVREVRVTLYDENGPKGGVDKRCMVRVRLLPRGEAVVSKSGADVLTAVALAAECAKEVVGRRAGRRSRQSPSRGQIDIGGVSI